METEQELNKKLADKLNKFVGFQWLKATDGEYHWFDADKNIVGPTDEEGDIIWDMNACFKWLVPEVNQMGWGINLMQAMNNSYWKCVLWEWGNPFTTPLDHKREDAETPALALCKAIEKLIGDKDV